MDITLLGFWLKHVGRCARKTESNYKTRTSDRVWEGSKFSVKSLIHLHFNYLLSRTHFLMLLSSTKQVFPPLHTPPRPPPLLEDVYICPPMAPTNHSQLLQLYMFQTEYRQTSLLHQKGWLIIVNCEIIQPWGLTSFLHHASVSYTGLYWHTETWEKAIKRKKKEPWVSTIWEIKNGSSDPGVFCGTRSQSESERKEENQEEFFVRNSSQHQKWWLSRGSTSGTW